jgi:hypothetical protein
MQKFEYSTVAFETARFLAGPKLDHPAFNQKLNEYGDQGWEFVQAFPMTRGEGHTFEIVAVFKRPLTR